MKPSLILLFGAMISCAPTSREVKLDTDYMSVEISNSGYITSIEDKGNDKQYAVQGYPSPLLTLYQGKDVIIEPSSAKYDKTTDQITLQYPNGSVAKVQVGEQDEYITFKLLSLYQRGDIDNIVWGPVNTSISKTIGDIIAVVRDDNFAIGMMALDDNTIGGLPVDGDLAQMEYYVHSPDPALYPLPDSLHEGQVFGIGGDGINDIAFFSRPEEYFRLRGGGGATLEPEFGSAISQHSRDRRKPQTIFFTLLPGFANVNAPRHHQVETLDVDFIGSSVALYGCPDSKGLEVIENIVLKQGLPHVTVDGLWIRDPKSYRADIAWSGRHDSLVPYANRLGIKGVQDEGMGEYYPNPADRWAGKNITIAGKQIPIAEYTKQTNASGIAYGLHTLCEFIQPHSSDVTPVPSDSLCLVLRTTIDNDLTPTDTTIQVADTSYLNERGTWHDNNTNVLKIGKELLTYKGVTTTKPYTLTGVKRGAYKTVAQAHAKGSLLGKLQMNCYHGFVPDINLQDKYAEYYADLLVDGGMNYVDFDGLESCMYQGHGQYSFKRFFRHLFDSFRERGGDYLRVMGSGISEGNWLYMSIGNVGGDSHMFNPVTNQWGIEGKDVRNTNMSSYLPSTFGIQNLQPSWTVQVIENMQSKAVAWDATFMLGLNESNVEKCPQKDAIFGAFRIWEDARRANIFSDELKQQMRPAENLYHLERKDDDTWLLYQVSEGGLGAPQTLTKP